MSKFIDGSKHSFSSAVEAHIMGGAKPDLTSSPPFHTQSQGSLPAAPAHPVFNQGNGINSNKNPWHTGHNAADTDEFYSVNYSPRK